MAGRNIRTVDRQEVERAYPPGTRLRNTRDGKDYTIGVRAGTGSLFWMMCDGNKGKVDASVILRDFERVR